MSKMLTKKIFNSNSVSESRKFIYGLSILWIVFFHCNLQINTAFFSMVKSFGDCGVELFFLISGICLYFSFKKNQNIKDFYIRRIIRVMPYYIVFYGIVFVYFNIIKNFNFHQFFLNYSMLDFWLNGLGNVPWFLAAIIILYIAYPFIYKLFFNEYKCKKFWILFSMTLLLAGIIFLSIFVPHLKIFLYRIPIFLIGCILGKAVYEKQNIKVFHIIIIIFSLIITCILFNVIKLDFIRNLFYIPLSLFLILIMCLIYKLNSRHLSFINKPISFLGGFTLEIYLTHEKTQENFINILNLINIHTTTTNTIYQLSCIVLAIAISIGLSKLINIIINMIQNKNKVQKNL